MIENIYVYFILLASDLIPFDKYNIYLDSVFLNDDNDELLLELEFCKNDVNKIKKIIDDYIYDNKIELNYECIGRFLFEMLSEIYQQNKYDITTFGNRVYKVWQMLPEKLSMEEPYWTLSYADDCLSYGDEEQTRSLYERAFAYKW